MANKDAGLLTIRLGLGLLFLIAGLGKLIGAPLGPGIAGFSGMVWGSVVLAWLIALGELVGGISLFLGKGMKYATIWLAIIMVGAIFIASIPSVASGQPMALIGLLSNIVILTGVVGLMMTGPGSISMDK